jgi:hypothetical protein
MHRHRARAINATERLPLSRACRRWFKRCVSSIRGVALASGAAELCGPVAFWLGTPPAEMDERNMM